MRSISKFEKQGVALEIYKLADFKTSKLRGFILKFVDEVIILNIENEGTNSHPCTI